MKTTNLLPLLPFLTATLSMPTDLSLNLTVTPCEINAHKDAKMEIIAYSGAGCNDGTATVIDTKWTEDHKADTRSYSLSRALDPSEQLDFSAGWPGHECINYLSTAPNAVGKGCHDLDNPAMCLRLWHH